MPTAIARADQVTITPALGVCFWDRVEGRRVVEGLRVSAHAAAWPSRRVAGLANDSGVFVFHHIPGASAVVVEIVDTARRFLPFSFTASVPAPGLFVWACDPASAPFGAVPLYSAAARSLPAGQAVLRAQLQDATTGGPAAWTVLRAWLATGALLGVGVADEQGRVVVPFAYPEPAGQPLGSPGTVAPGLPGWVLQIEALYGPLVAPGSVPDLCAILNQPAGALWADAKLSGPPGPISLLLGQELTVRSQDVPQGTPLSVLLVSPAGAPPSSP